MVATTLIILFPMTGSVLLPIKVVVMNGLGLSAMFGILVLIFQDGNLQGLLGYRSRGALDAAQWPLNWWAPRPLRRLYERVGLHEGAPRALAAGSSAPLLH